MTTTTAGPMAGQHLHSPRHTRWSLAITSLALFMATLDNLVVTMALPAIRAGLHASIQSLEWTVNAYTLTFAVLLLTGAALGDRLGRRRMFVIGLAVFTAASAAAALSPGTGPLIAARAVQGAGAAIILPLTLTLLSEATPPRRRGMALGIWSGVSGLGVAIGPLAGGAVVQGLDWHWIFWINVPVGVALLPLARTRLAESRGPSRRLDMPGLALAGAGMALVFAPVSSAVLASVAPAEVGQASGATNAIREFGGVLGVAVLAAVFSAHGSYAAPASFAAGLTAALPVGAAFLAAGAVIALLVPRHATS